LILHIFFSSKIIISDSNSLAPSFFALQLGPDGKIYVAQYGTDSLGVINEPNKLGIGCNYVPSAIYLDTNYCDLGLPNFFPYLVVSPNPDFTFSGSCAGDSTYFTSINLSSSDTFLWNFGDAISGKANNNSKLLNPSHFYKNSGIYSVTIYASINGQKDTIKQSVTISKMPINNLPSDTSDCSGTLLTLNAGNTGSTYLWSNGNVLQKITVAQPGTYWVQVTNSGLCSITDTIHIKNIPYPVIILPKDTTICGASSFKLTAGKIGYKYLWSNGDTTSSIIIAKSGIYNVTVSNGTCSASDTVNVKLVPLPAIYWARDTSICGSSSFALNARNAGASYIWSTGATTRTINITKSGLYWVSVNNGTCSSNDTISVSFGSLSVNLGRDTILCNASSYTLDAGVSGVTYHWSTGDTTRRIIVNTSSAYWVSVTNGTCTGADTINVTFRKSPTVYLPKDTITCQQTLSLNPITNGTLFNWSTGATTQSISVNQAGKYSVMVSNGFCTSSDTTNVQFQTAFKLNIGNDTIVCGINSYTIDAGIPGLKYLWSTGETSQKITVNTSGTYWVNVTNGTCSASDTIIVTFKNAPAITLLKDTTVCAGEMVTLQADMGAENYLWSTGGTTNYISVQKPGNYWVIASNPPCSTKATATFSNFPLPSIPLFVDKYLCVDEHESIVEWAGPKYKHLWLPSGDSSSTIIISDTGTYILQNIDNRGCVNDDTLHVYRQCPPLLFIPTAFTPNGDGIDDIYKPVGSDVTAFEMRIYNRWGELLFSSSDINTGWNGSFNGNPSQDGVYLYQVHYEGECHNEKILKDLSGTLLLAR